MNHNEARGKSVTAICAKPNRLGVSTTARAENKPVASPKSSLIQTYITATSAPKNSAGPIRYAVNLSRKGSSAILAKPETIRENGGCGTLYGFQCQAALIF